MNPRGVILHSLMVTFRTPANALSFFIVLQCMDTLTTLAFLNKGLAEGNPLVSWILSGHYGPLTGLIVTKLIAAVIGWYCYNNGRMRLLRRANAGYSLVVAWNLVGIGAAVIAQ